MNDNIKISDLLGSLPNVYRRRFGPLRSFVKESLYPDYSTKVSNFPFTVKTKELAILNEKIDEAALVAFIFQLNKFFIEGHRAAVSAVDTLKELKVDGFYIGSKYFKGRNEQVMMGKKLSYNLLECLDDPEIENLIKESNYFYEIINFFKNDNA